MNTQSSWGSQIILLVIAISRLRSNRGSYFLIAAAAVLFILTLGFWPYRYLFRFMPYSGIIEPGRFFAVLYIPITLLILVELQQISSRPLLLAVALLIGIERLPLHYHLSPTQLQQTVTNYDSVLAKQKRDATMESLMTYDIRAVLVHNDLFGSEMQCGAAPQFIDALFEEGERWEVLLESPTKRVLWLRP